MRKLYLSLGLFLVASQLCTACGLKNDLYLPEEQQAKVSKMPLFDDAVTTLEAITTFDAVKAQKAERTLSVVRV